MRVFIASDHTGFELKKEIKKFLGAQGYDVEDCGAHVFDPGDDYPDFIKVAAKKVSENPGSFGIIMGGSGQGEQMVANKQKGVRCALFYAKAFPSAAIDINGNRSSDPFEIVKLSRIHNDANILSIGVRFVREEDAINAVKTFLETPFSGDERHKRRIEKISQLEHNS